MEIVTFMYFKHGQVRSHGQPGARLRERPQEAVDRMWLMGDAIHPMLPSRYVV